jgi:hypothetical protein
VGKVTNYVDFAFRISSAYLMEMEEFDLENITTDAELQERKCLTILPQVQLSLLPKWIVFFIMESIFPIMFTWQPFIDLRPPPSCYIVVPLLAAV